MNFSSLRSINRAVENKRMNIYIAEVESNPSSGRHLGLFLVWWKMFLRPILGWELLQKPPVTISHVRNHKLGWQRPVNSKYQPTDNSLVAVLELQNGTKKVFSELTVTFDNQLIQLISESKWIFAPNLAFLTSHHENRTEGRMDIHRFQWRGGIKNVSTTVIRPGWQTTRTLKYHNWKDPQSTCRRS